MKFKIIDRYDAGNLIGLPVVVLGAARQVEEHDGPAIAIPRIEDLSAAAAVARCQMAPRLRGKELRALRAMLDLTQPALAAAIGGGSAETVSRWESEASALDDKSEKLVRLVVCERLKEDAPGVPYSALDLIGLKLTERVKKMAPMEFRFVEVKIGRSIEERWTTTALEVPAKKAA